MKYIFEEKSNSPTQKGKLPIDYFQICWYDMDKNQQCFDEDIIEPGVFNSNCLTYIDTDENEGDSDRTRIFVHHINKDVYELCLHKLTEEEYSKCNSFYGGRIK